MAKIQKDEENRRLLEEKKKLAEENAKKEAFLQEQQKKEKEIANKNKEVISKLEKEINNNNFNNLTKKQKNLNNGVGLNNNKIEYVQINLFNGGNDEKITKEGKNLIFNKFEKRRNQPRKKINKSKDKEVKLFDNDINCSNDGIYLTNTYLSYNDKSKRNKEI